MKYLLLLITISSSLLSTQLILTGTVISNNQKMIPARYMGYVKKINFVIGDKVEREDTLFELESAEFDIMKSQANLALEQSKLLVDMYQEKISSLKKDQKRFKNNTTSNSPIQMQDLEETTNNVSASLEVAQTLVKQSAQKAKQFANIMGYLKVKAPSAGILVEKNIRVGDMVGPGMLTMVILDMEHLEIEAEVAESNLKYIKRNEKVKVTIPSFDFKTSGYIKAVVPSANPMSHTFKIRVHFDKLEERIFPGMYAKVYINLKDKTK